MKKTKSSVAQEPLTTFHKEKTNVYVYQAAEVFASYRQKDLARPYLIRAMSEEKASGVLNTIADHKEYLDGGYVAFLEAVNKVMEEENYYWCKEEVSLEGQIKWRQQTVTEPAAIYAPADGEECYFSTRMGYPPGFWIDEAYDWCSRMGIEINKVYSDFHMQEGDITAGRCRGVTLLVEDAIKGKFRKVLFWDFDEMFRLDPYGMYKVIATLRSINIEYQSIGTTRGIDQMIDALKTDKFEEMRRREQKP